jgi:hypothetical protein
MSGSHKSNRINPGEVGVVAFAHPIRATRSRFSHVNATAVWLQGVLVEASFPLSAVDTATLPDEMVVVSRLAQPQQEMQDLSVNQGGLC